MAPSPRHGRILCRPSGAQSLNELPIRIAPSILACDFGSLAGEISAVAAAGADWIHVDVMDGHFVPNLTIGPPVVAAVRAATKKPLDVHLMIEAPERSIGDYVAAGADRVGVHVETCPHLHRTIAQIQDLGVKACVVLNPGTPAGSIEPVIADVDQVLVMSVNPGFGGQSFIQSSLDKLRQIRAWAEERNPALELEIDGGITMKTIGQAAAAGANAFVAGTAVFKGSAEQYPQRIAALREEAEAARHS
ncbi:MAG: ribulose-phosphate 3-epimerase [bacterium]|nr:ribulose-phosphate 3-epimerase [bacterium]MCP5068233.1 ribulose-phosphate 3-epimerase [bacterium]